MDEYEKIIYQRYIDAEKQIPNFIDKGMRGESIASDAPLEVRDQTDTKDKYVMSRALEKYITQNRPMLKDRADKIRNHHGKPEEYWSGVVAKPCSTS